MTRARTAAAFGFAGALLAFLVPMLAARAHAGYSNVSQFISELGASGAPHGSVVSLAGFAPTGFCVLAFLQLAVGVFPRSRLARTGAACLGAVGVAYLISAIFRCDPGCPNMGSLSQSIHNVFGFLEYLGAATGLLLLSAAFRDDVSWKSLSGASAIAATLVVLGFAAMLAPSLASVRGISQRIAEFSIFAWLVYTSVLLVGYDEPAVRRAAEARGG